MRTTSFLLVFSLLWHGCIQLFAVRTMGGVLEHGLEAFQEESDLELAESGLASNLKLIEALIKADPENERLLFIASQGYSAYGLAFAEDEDPARARLMYLRAKAYGMRILDENTKFRASRDGDLQNFTKALQTFSKDDIPAVFWTAFAWGSYVNLSRTETAALADIPKVNAMMEFVLQHDPAYYYAGAHVYFGTLLGSTPVLLGGKPEAAKEHFQKALELTGGKFLMTYVYYARSYAVQTQDQELFESLLAKVDSASIDILPEARLPNAVAKKKALALRARVNELF
ncbi:MAG TPA: TRAP transporter TatT component family protein [Bacteroidota bacterium]|nr:TRAP transporter TatT component family protein [Bacteroidota bacterium]